MKNDSDRGQLLLNKIRAVFGFLSYFRAPFSAYVDAWFIAALACAAVGYALDALRQENGRILGLCWLGLTLFIVSLRKTMGEARWNGYFTTSFDDDEDGKQ